jgi:hypothetical protein
MTDAMHRLSQLIAVSVGRMNPRGHWFALLSELRAYAERAPTPPPNLNFVEEKYQEGSIKN